VTTPAGDPVEENRRLWDARTPIHVASAFYDVDGFRAGASSLHDLEVGEVGDVTGRSLLHLQCHFGLDTLSWARLGAAPVVGLDFSGAAVAAARRLAEEVGLADVATFVEADVREAPTAVGGRTFDVVFTSYGALTWLPSLAPWAEAAAACVAPGGFLYVAELHPATQVLDDTPGIEDLRIGYPYWTTPEAPLSFLEPGTYADVDADIELPEHCWQHGLGDVVTSLLDAGLVLEFLHEHDRTVYPQLPFLEEDGEGWWRLPEGLPTLPFVFSLRARKPA
jgi:SAM-dependent methyltransferase